MGAVELTALTALWTTVTWIGMDMYLPALPVMVETFAASEGLVNMTLFSFQVAMALGALLGGAVSDKLGRRIPLTAGGAMFTLGCLVCAVASDVAIILVARFVAGLGGGFVGAITMAVIKDCLEGEALDRAITVTQSLIIVGPIAAPFLGSMMIGLLGWRGIFVFLTVAGALCMVWSAFLAESLEEDARAEVPLAKTLGLLVDVARNRDFSLLLVALSAPSFCFGVFMAVCSYVYLDDFSLGYEGYSICYALTTVVSIAGPFIYLALQKRCSNRYIVIGIGAALAVTGCAMLAVGPLAAVAFLLTCCPFALAESIARPCSYMVLLGGAQDKAGSASALIGFSIGVFCALGTPAAALPLGSHITCLGVMIALSGVVSLGIVAFLVYGVKSRILE